MKYLKIIIYAVLFLLFYGTFFFDSNFIVIIYTKQISLLAFIGLSLYDISNAYQKNILRKHNLSTKKQNILLFSRFTLFGVVMILTASIQLEYIDYSYTLQEKTCSIYDKHQNLVFNAAYYNNCPEVEIISNNDNYLELIITDQIGAYHETLTIEDIEYKDVTATTIKVINVYITYDNSIIEYVHYRMDQWTAFETDITALGYVNAIDQIVDYQDGYIFKEASEIIRLNLSYEDIMNYDTSLIQFNDVDYEIKEYVVSDKLTSENYIAYDVSRIQDGIQSNLFEFLLAKDQLNPIPLTDYSLNFEITEEAALSGRVTNAVSVNYLDHGIQMDTISEYEGEGYYNTFIFSTDIALPILESHHSNHIENGEITNEGFTSVDTFERGGQIFYYTNKTNTGINSLFDYEEYHTIQETDYGYMVIEYNYYYGSFTEFLFDQQEQDPYSYYILGLTASIYQQQLSLFDSTDNPFYDRTNGIFITVPIYIQKTALE